MDKEFEKNFDEEKEMKITNETEENINQKTLFESENKQEKIKNETEKKIRSEDLNPEKKNEKSESSGSVFQGCAIKIFSVLSVFLVSICVILLVVRGKLVSKAESIGNNYGELWGNVFGGVETVFKLEDTYNNARAEGLSAKDTKVDIGVEMQKMNKLEVLVASVKLKSLHEISGDKKDPDYVALYLLKGEIIFTVDFSRSIYDEEKQTLFLPVPEYYLSINQDKTEKLSEYQKHFFSGDVQSGYEAYLNSMKEIHNASEENIANYDLLLEEAKESAKKQVSEIINTVSSSAIEVGFIDESGDENE